MDFELTKNATVDSLDKVPEPFRPLYTQAEGGYALNESFKGLAQSVDGLNGSLKAARRDADAAKRNRPDLSGFQAIGQLLGLEGDDAASPDALRAAVDRVISESKDGKVNYEKLKQSLEQGYQQKLQAKDGEIQGMSKSLQKYLVDSAAVSAIAANKGVPDLLLPHIRARTKVVKDGEDYVVRVVDDAGDPRGNASGGFMTVEDLVKELKGHATFGRAFESESPSGNGTPPGGPSGKAPQRPATDTRNPTEKIAHALRTQRR